MTAGAGTTSAAAWVSVEGANGVGKTYLGTSLVARLGGRARLLSELTDVERENVTGQVIGALSCGRSFLRTGHPLTETFALLALKVREYELVAGLAEPPAIVVEDRGVDTVALYQASILLGPDAADDEVWAMAQGVHETAAMWRPLPRLTLLIVDDLDACERRYADREGRSLAPDERQLVGCAARLYLRQAEHEPDRFRVIHRSGRHADRVVDELERHVLDAAGER